MRTILALGLCAVALAGCSGTRSRAPSGAAPAPETVTELVLRPGQTQATGTLTTLSATSAVAAPVPVPFTIDVATRGEGGATINAAVVGGRRSTIVWDGGRPLPVTGNGALDLGAAKVDVTPARIRWSLDGQPRGLVTGRYRLGATVAVGQQGLATPTDGATFDADSRTALVTRGGARIELRSAPLELEGPGTVELRGRLHLRTATGERDVAWARFVEGPFVVKLSPVPGGYSLDGLFQGPLAG